MNKTTSKRLLALDILRGITIAGMIMVNNPGSWSYVYAPLGHAQWNGLTPTDLVFPFFMFIMGISTYISLRKYNFEFSHSAALKILKRTIVIFAIGLGLAWFSMFCRTWNSLSAEEISFFSRLGQSIWTFDHIRILGVMATAGTLLWSNCHRCPDHEAQAYPLPDCDPADRLLHFARHRQRIRVQQYQYTFGRRPCRIRRSAYV